MDNLVQCKWCKKYITKKEYDLYDGLCGDCENERVDEAEDRANDYD